MEPARRSARIRMRSTAFAVAVVVFALGACTREDGAPPTGDDGSAQTSPPPLTSAESYVFTDAAGIEARLTLHEHDASLTVANDTGEPLPRPGVFALDARDGSRVRWTVVDADLLPSGENSEFTVERPPVPEAKNIGLVVMTFGGEDYGAFVPPAPGTAA